MPRTSAMPVVYGVFKPFFVMAMRGGPADAWGGHGVICKYREAFVDSQIAEVMEKSKGQHVQASI